MFCKQCGTNLPEGAKVCPTCGAAVKSSEQVSNQDVKSTSGQASENDQQTSHTVSVQSVQLPKVNKEFILKNINTILAIIAIISTFVPMLVMNTKELGYSNKLSVSGFEIAQGMRFNDANGSETSVNIFAWLIILIPVFAILTNYIKQLFSFKKVMLFAAPLVSGICLFLAKSTFSSGMNCTISGGIGFWVYLFDSLVWLLVGYLQYKNMPLTKDSVINLVNQKK